LPPSLLRVEFAEIAKTMSLDDLQTAIQVFQLELDAREGRRKFEPVLPEHVRLILN
jgi:hypothetical protein